MPKQALNATRRAPFLALALLALSLTACGKHWLPSENTVYREACAAILADPAAANASLAPIENCRLFIGKSAARIDVPFADGSGSYTVWFKRVARTWTVHRIHPTASPPDAGQRG